MTIDVKWAAKVFVISSLVVVALFGVQQGMPRDPGTVPLSSNAKLSSQLKADLGPGFNAEEFDRHRGDTQTEVPTTPTITSSSSVEEGSHPPSTSGGNGTTESSFSDCLADLKVLLQYSFLSKPGSGMKKDVGFPSPTFIGWVVSKGGGPDASPQVSSIKASPKAALRGAHIANMVSEAMTKLTKPTIFFISGHDVDFWTIAKGRQEEGFMHQLMDRCPGLFLLSWNPCELNASSGAMGRRTIPIPDAHPWPNETLRAPPVANRSQLIIWRGVTTGPGAPGLGYRRSDRYFAVLAFNGVPGASVKFTNYVQNVDRKVVGPQLMSGRLPTIAQLGFRLQLDVDGNANAWMGLRWKLSSGSSVIKVQSTRRCVQWYYPHLQDGTHLRTLQMPKTTAGRTLLRNFAEDVALNVSQQLRLSTEAEAFGKRFLYRKPAMAYLTRTIQNVWSLDQSFYDRSWFIREANETDRPLPWVPPAEGEETGPS